jgi:hypothetical protein
MDVAEDAGKSPGSRDIAVIARDRKEPDLAANKHRVGEPQPKYDEHLHWLRLPQASAE